MSEPPFRINLWTVAVRRCETRVIQAFSRFGSRGPPVDETVDNLCCIWGEWWKITRM